ncbi:MAG: GtrA family protein [Acidimicrobiia bacterium]|nr:GtrA family protein [Acidimicrobiia bacterium]
MRNYLKTFLNRESATQITTVAVIGVINTVVDFSVFNVLRSVSVSRFWAVTVALLIATFVSYLLNRRYTFKLHDGRVTMREAIQFYAVNLAAWAVTLGVIELADVVFGPLSLLGENFAKVAAVAIILLPKFAAYRDVVFGKALKHRAAQAAAESTDSEPASLDSRSTEY